MSNGSIISDSEYLTKTLPRSHVKDFLLDDAASLAVVVVSSNKLYQVRLQSRY